LAFGLGFGLRSADGAAATPALVVPPGCKITAHAQADLYPGYLHAECAALSNDTIRWKRNCFMPGLNVWAPEGNIFVRLPDPARCPLAESDEWTISGWRKRFVSLAPGAAFTLPTGDTSDVPMYKLLSGTVLNVDTNGVQHDDGTWESFTVTVPNSVKSIKIDRGVEQIMAGSDGAAFVYYVAPRAKLNTVLVEGDMLDTSSVVHEIAGPYVELLQWRMFGSYGCCMQYRGLPWWNLAGFFVQDHTEQRVAYVQYWTLEEGVDTGDYHDHSDTVGNGTFGELHVHMYHGSGVDGMQSMLPATVYTNSKPRPPAVPAGGPYVVNGSSTGWINWQGANESVQLGIAIPPGHVHGPLWLVHSDGRPVMAHCDDDARRHIQYPMHRNLVGRMGPGMIKHTPQRLMMLIAFEHPPQYCNVPSSLLSQDNAIQKNAYVQSRDEFHQYC